MKFNNLVDDIENIGYDWHKETIVQNSANNASHINKKINDLESLSDEKSESAIIVSAGPSLHYSNTLNTLASSNYTGTIIAIDGSYVKCLKAGISPDFVLTLDPHPTRMVRWFGDPDFEVNMEGDDYFNRQDLDIDFRENSKRQNSENIEIVNEYAPRTKLLIASTAPQNMVKRSEEAGFDMYWWMPLVDDPDSDNSITRKMYDATHLPAINTGGNVGTSAWAFAQFWFEIQKIAVIGMDLGYKKDLPYNMTQTYPELVDVVGEENISSEYFPQIEYPQTGEVFYTDPTYYWYRKNILDLISNSDSILYNCTEGGTLFGDGVICMTLKEFMKDMHG